MNARAPSTTAILAWTFPSTKGSGFSLQVKISFVPVRGKARQGMEIVRAFHLQPNPKAVWSSTRPEKSIQREGFVLADTDGDGRTDTFLPGTSNFAPGVSSLNKAEEMQCHYEDDAEHCLII